MRRLTMITDKYLRPCLIVSQTLWTCTRLLARGALSNPRPGVVTEDIISARLVSAGTPTTQQIQSGYLCGLSNSISASKSESLSAPDFAEQSAYRLRLRLIVFGLQTCRETFVVHMLERMNHVDAKGPAMTGGWNSTMTTIRSRAMKTIKNQISARDKPRA